MLVGSLGAVAGIAGTVRVVGALRGAFEGVAASVRAVSAASPVLRAFGDSSRVYAAALDAASLGNSRFAASLHASRTAARSLLGGLRAVSAFAAGPYVIAFAAAAAGVGLLLLATRGAREEARLLNQVLNDEIEPAEGVDALRAQLTQLQEAYERVQERAEKFRPGSRGADLAERAMLRLRVEITEVGVALQDVTGESIVSLPALATTIDQVTEQMRALFEETEQLRAADGDSRQIEALVEQYNAAGAELGSLLAIQRELQGIEFLDDAQPIQFARDVASTAAEATAEWRVFRDQLEGTAGIDLENIGRALRVGLVTPIEAARDRVQVLERGLQQLIEFRGTDGDSFFNPDGSPGKTISAHVVRLQAARAALAAVEVAGDSAGAALVAALGSGAESAQQLFDNLQDVQRRLDEQGSRAGIRLSVALPPEETAQDIFDQLQDVQRRLNAQGSRAGIHVPVVLPPEETAQDIFDQLQDVQRRLNAQGSRGGIRVPVALPPEETAQDIFDQLQEVQRVLNAQGEPRRASECR